MPKKEHVISTRGPETARGNSMKHRWPRSLHSQVEAIFHSIRSIPGTENGQSARTPFLRLLEGLQIRGSPLRGLHATQAEGKASLTPSRCETTWPTISEEMLAHFVERKRSRQTMETLLVGPGEVRVCPQPLYRAAWHRGSSPGDGSAPPRVSTPGAGSCCGNRAGCSTTGPIPTRSGSSRQSMTEPSNCRRHCNTKVACGPKG